MAIFFVVALNLEHQKYLHHSINWQSKKKGKKKRKRAAVFRRE
jgi:hypothetical protein